jgi:HEAT repeat protein
MEINPAISALVSGLHDERDGLRQFALRRLVKMGPQVIPALIETLKDNKEYTQECAAIGLASFGTAAIQPLLDAMKHDNRRIRWAAAWVLASMGPEARNAVPEVVLPGAKAARVGSGVWSDSWLTKVRQQLNAAKLGEAGGLSAAQPELC